MLSTISKKVGSFSRSKLHHYQVNSVEFIKQNPFCALWVDMGLGKTVATLTALSDLIDSFEVHRILVIAPLRVAKYTWPEEIERWEHTSHLSYSVVCGAWAQRAKSAKSNAPIHIVNRENVAWLVDHFSRGLHKPNYEWPYDMVVIDESSSFKSSKTKRFKSLRKVLPNIDRLVQLTGTPASNGLLDLWSQIYLLDKGDRLGRTFSGFKQRYFSSDFMGYNWTPLPGTEEEIYDRLSDLCLTLSADDYLELPDRIENTLVVDISPTTRSQYRQLEKDFLLELESDDVVVQHAASLTNKLLQFSNGAVYTDDQGHWEALHESKLDALEEVINESAGQPILVAYNFKSDKERILKRFKKAVCIDDKNAIKRWNKKEVELLIAHPASAGHGLNLQSGGNIIVWFGLNWSLELYQQFNARLHRQGQTKPVIIHHIVLKDSVDESVIEALNGKDQTQQALLEALKNDIRERTL